MKTIVLSLIIAPTLFLFDWNQETCAQEIETIEETEGVSEQTLLEIGQIIASKTQSILGKNLMQVISAPLSALFPFVQHKPYR